MVRFKIYKIVILWGF